jgi:glutamate 5-kinase
MSLYTAALDAHALTPAQVLLTADDLRDRPRALMARRTLLELLERNAVPIVNENDAVAFEEIAFGDNDRLSALVAQSVGADALALLSVADAVRENQGRGPIIPCAHDIDATLAHAGGHSSSVGVGGMRAKLEAARIATHAGTTTVIAGGREENVIERLFAGERLGTIVPASQRRSARRAWIAHAARPAGRLLVDAGAVRALTTRGASLLPAGLLRVEGDFERGVVVEIVDEATGRAIARGLCEYASTEANAIAGRRASEIEAALGYRYADELVHRDDLSLLPTTARTDEDDAP